MSCTGPVCCKVSSIRYTKTQARRCRACAPLQIGLVNQTLSIRRLPPTAVSQTRCMASPSTTPARLSPRDASCRPQNQKCARPHAQCHPTSENCRFGTAAHVALADHRTVVTFLALLSNVAVASWPRPAPAANADRPCTELQCCCAFSYSAEGCWRRDSSAAAATAGGRGLCWRSRSPAD